MKQIMMRVPNESQTIQSVMTRAKALIGDFRNKSFPPEPMIIELKNMRADKKTPGLYGHFREEAQRCGKTSAGAGWSVDFELMDNHAELAGTGEVIIFNNERTARIEIGFSINNKGQVAEGMLLNVDIVSGGRYYSIKGLNTKREGLHEQAMILAVGKVFTDKDSYLPEEYQGSPIFSMIREGEDERRTNHPSSEAISTAISVLGLANGIIGKALMSFVRESKMRRAPAELKEQVKVASA